MKGKSFLVLMSLLLSFVLISFRDPPKVKIREIINNPAFYEEQKVEIEGTVLEFDESLCGTSCYLQGEEQEIIQVDLKGKEMKIYYDYLITGIVHRDSVTKKAYIVLTSGREGKYQQIFLQLKKKRKTSLNVLLVIE